MKHNALHTHVVQGDLWAEPAPLEEPLNDISSAELAPASPTVQASPALPDGILDPQKVLQALESLAKINSWEGIETKARVGGTIANHTHEQTRELAAIARAKKAALGRDALIFFAQSRGEDVALNSPIEKVDEDTRSRFYQFREQYGGVNDPARARLKRHLQRLLNTRESETA